MKGGKQTRKKDLEHLNIRYVFIYFSLPLFILFCKTSCEYLENNTQSFREKNNLEFCFMISFSISCFSLNRITDPPAFSREQSYFYR